MTAEEILRRYDDGETTADGLLLDILTQTSNRVIAEALVLLPPKMLGEIEEFVGYYTPKTLIVNSPRPNAKALRFIKEWFAIQKRAVSA